MQTTITNNDPSIDLMRAALTARGFAAKKLDLYDPYTRFTAPGGRTWLTRDATMYYPFIPHGVQQLSRNKQLAYEFVASQGVTIPATLRYPRQRARLEAHIHQFAPVVVKPIDSSGSRGITLGIRTMEACEQAIDNARTYSDTVLVQQQLAGEEIRFTILDGEVVSVLQRKTPAVIGDGRQTVIGLIAAENEARSRLRFPYLQYPQLDSAIIDGQFLQDGRIPAAGEVVGLSKSTLISGGASLYDVSGEVHASYLQIASRLAAALNPEFLVVDLMIQDMSQPQTKTNYAFLEFNTAPTLRLYYSIRDGKAFDIVGRLADKIQKGNGPS